MITERISLKIAGITIRISGRPAMLAPLRAGRYSDFLSYTERPDLDMELAEEPADPKSAVPAPETMVFDSGTVWSLYATGSTISILLRNPARGGLPYRVAVFDRELAHARISGIGFPGYEESMSDYDPLEFPLSEVAMVCLLARGRGVMVHACGISDGGRGLLFPGNSTHGKSTMARLWKGKGRILNDDRIILRPSGDGFRMYGTPWHGDMSDVSAEGVVLSSVRFLFHGQGDRARPVKGARAASMLLQRSFLPLWDREGMDFTLSLCEEVVRRVPCSRLHFIPDENVVEFLR